MRKKERKSNFLFVTLLLAVLMFCMLVPRAEVLATTQKLSQSRITLYAIDGMKKTADLKVSGTYQKIKWVSSNEKIASVNANGRVTAKSAGKCTIVAYVTWKNNSTINLKCQVTVYGEGTEFTEGNLFCQLSSKGTLDVSPADTKSANIIIPQKIRGFTVTSMSDFNNHREITSISIPAGVSVPDWGFSGCTNLKKVTYYGNSTRKYSIGKYAFRHLSALETVTFADGLTSIGEEAFLESGVKEIALPDTVKTLGDMAFMSCKSLKKVKLSNALTEVPDRAFSFCNALTEVEFGKNIRTVGIGAFEQDDLREVVLPDSVTYIRELAFCENRNLTKVVLSKNLDTIGYKAFQWSAFKNITLPDGLLEIGGDAFAYSLLESITIPKSVRKIDTSFYYCEQLKDVKILGNPEIDYAAFKGTAIYNEMTGGMIIINHQLLKYEGDSGTVTVPDGVTKIARYAFEGAVCEQVVLPDTVKEIDFAAFAESELKSIVIPDSVETIGIAAFEDCYCLESVVLPKGLTELLSSTFSGCSSLTDIVIPDSVQSIGGNCFMNCSNLENVTMAQKDILFYLNPFAGTKFLEKLRDKNGLAILGNTVLDGQEAKGNVTVPDGIRMIAAGAFTGNSEITSLTLPESVKYLGRLYCCENLASLSAPGVKSMDTIDYCPKLKRVDLRNMLYLDGKFIDCPSLREFTLTKSVPVILREEVIGSGCLDWSDATIHWVD